MRFLIIIPAFNEETFIARCLKSLLAQSHLPTKIVVVDDNSTDRTPEIIDSIAAESSVISLSRTCLRASDEVLAKASGRQEPSKKYIPKNQIARPGAKVIHAFHRGLDEVDIDNYDVVCKFDADLEFPIDYLQRINKLFIADPSVGMAGGVCSLQIDGEWKRESKLNDDHLRGALKAYKVECFKQIGGLQPSMGWDTLDEMLARFYSYKIAVDTSLMVKHLKPTGSNYGKDAAFLQGQALYRIGYSIPLVVLTALKLRPRFLSGYLRGFFSSQKKGEEKLVTPEQEKFIRQYRWQGIRTKYF